jgi:predicted MFS family arabinose efflux permease
VSTAPAVPPGDGPPGLQRDGITATGYLVLAAWGWFLYGFGALLPQLGRDQGISRTVTGVHSVMLAVGALLAGVFAIPLVRALRRRGVLRLGGGLVLVGTGLLTAGGAWTAVTLIAALIAGTGGSLLVNTATTTMSDHHRPQGAAALAEGNALAASCGLLSPLLVGAGVAAGLTWRPAVLITVPLVLAMLLLLRRQPGRSALDQQLPPRQGRRAALPAAVWPAAGVLVACVGVEFCLGSWSAELLREQVGLSAGAAAAGVSAVIAGMTLGRVVTGRLALRHSARRLLLAAILIALVGWTGTWLAVVPAAALAGLFVTGVGVGAHYPLSASIALSAAPGQHDQAVGILSIGVGLAAGAGPFALGALADASSTHRAFLVVPVLLLVAAVLLLASSRKVPTPRDEAEARVAGSS